MKKREAKLKLCLVLGTFQETLTRNHYLSFIFHRFLRCLHRTIAKCARGSYFIGSIVLGKNKQVKNMFTKERQVVCFKSLNKLINFTFIFKRMIFYCRRCIYQLDYGLRLRLHLSNQVHEPCIRSSNWVTSKHICNL